MRVRVVRAERVRGASVAPGDKSVSHRALILSSISEGNVEISNLAPGADVRSTARCLSDLGAEIRLDGSRAHVAGGGLSGLRQPRRVLDCGNSGTTMRLLSGVVAGSGVGGVLDGDSSLRRRPMRRVLQPLREMVAVASGAASGQKDETAPLRFESGHRLLGRRHQLAIASAQVKSCLLLAGLWAEGVTEVREPSPSRDHTERMLRALGAPVEQEADGTLRIRPPDRPLVAPKKLVVPGDPSSAAFLTAAAALADEGEIEVRSVNANPTRWGFFNALARMGASVELRTEARQAGEEVATVLVRGGRKLGSTEIGPGEVPSLIDEIPILGVLATQAVGTTTIRGASELRHKESDRIAQLAGGLTAMGANVEELPDGLIIHGRARLRGANIDSMSDHRIAMSFAIAGLVADGETTIDGAEWADISFPGFFQLLAKFTGSVEILPG